MRTLKILTVVGLAAASSVASADDQYGRDYDYDYDRDGYRGARDYRGDSYDRDRHSRWDRDRHDGGWVPLVRGTPADDGRQNVVMRGRGARLDKLRLQADRGAPVIQRIAVEYQNGVRAIVRLNTQLQRGQAQLIDLDDDQRVRRIVVFTDPRYRGMYSVYGDMET